MAQSAVEVRAAVERCLQDCYARDSPVVPLAEGVENLRAKGWEPAEIRRVESLGLKVLAAVTSPQNRPNEPEQSDLT